MWKVEYNYTNRRYYLVNRATKEKRIVPNLTQKEVDEKRYQQYFDKAYVMCCYLNGEDVYHTRTVNGKRFIYKKHR